MVENVLTCSCGYSNAFDVDAMVLSEFCQMYEKASVKDPLNSDYYRVNCVTDLDDEGTNPWVS